MTVCRRPVASWKPHRVGDSGLDRVGTRKTGVKVPPPTRDDQGKGPGHCRFSVPVEAAERPFVRDLSAVARSNPVEPPRDNRSPRIGGLCPRSSRLLVGVAILALPLTSELVQIS
jgi:hypothetical protein